MNDLTLRIQRNALEPVTTGTCALYFGPIVVYRAHTLELPWKDNERSISCIPEGEYGARFTMSNRFRVVLWEVLNVPNRSGIRIHAANYSHQLEGCIALGMQSLDMDKDGKLDIARSGEAMRLFHQACDKQDQMRVVIANPASNA
jgi:hypothetical protein